MPSPVAPSAFQESIPANNADLCTRMSKFLNVPALLYELFSWMFTASGAVSAEFKAEVATYATPTGMLGYFATQSVGDGWLYADGRAVSREDYAALFTAIGTRYGAGDGSTTFNLPDARSLSLIGAGQGSALTGLSNRDINTKYVGEETHTITEDELPAHVHTVEAWGAGGTSGDGGDILNQPDPAGQRNHETLETGGDSPMNIVHPCLIGYCHIKT